MRVKRVMEAGKPTDSPLFPGTTRRFARNPFVSKSKSLATADGGGWSARHYRHWYKCSQRRPVTLAKSLL